MSAPPMVDLELAAQLRLVVTRLARRLRQLDVAADGITMSQLSALYVVDKVGPVALGDLAAAEKVQPPTMTRIVARLEELGLVAREAQPGDRRVALVRSTRAGHRLVEASRRRRTAALAETLAGLTDAERDVLAAAVPVLDRLVEP